MPDLQQTVAPATSGAAGRRRAPAGDRRRRSRLRLVLLLAVAVLLVMAAVVAVLLVRSARTAEDEAAAARADLGRVKGALAAGDPATARRAQSSAARHVAAALAESREWPVTLAGKVPVARGATQDLEHLLAAADHVVRSSGGLVAAYGQVTGDDTPLVRDGRIDLSRLPAMRQRLDDATANLRAAERELRLVDGGLPGLGRIDAERDAALAEVTPARRALDRTGVVLSRLPAALGADRPKRYLLAISNESELRASGGAPLSVAVLTFDDGTLSVGRSVQAEDLPEELTWRGDPGSPFNNPDGTRTDRFANASFHPDFRTAAQDLMGAATAAGFPRLDGVVAVDVRALAEVLRATGPLESAAYGDITADNVGQKLLVDAYATYADDQDVRQGLNLQLRDALLERLLAGDGTVAAVGALGGSAAGRHVQVYSTDPVLEGQLSALGAGGAVRTGAHDLAAVFSQNGNGSKVDVFQRRTIQVRARLGADGSARVTQTVVIGNEVPAERSAVRKRSGYLTGWSRNAYFLYLPAAATTPRLSSPTDRFRVMPFPGGTWVDDGHGHRFGRVVGTLAPGASGRITLSYQLPPGTFGSDARLSYSLRALAQPMWYSATLELDVSGPGLAEKRRVSLAEDQVVTVRATP